jgi:uncharacterized protein YaiI (UPF0178 family)
MRLWVDADAAPRLVKEVVGRAGARLGVDVLMVSNQRLQTPANNPLVSAIRVSGGPDVADDYIVEHAEPGDLVVTADIPLAARLVEKGVTAIDPRGDVYDEATIGERLSIRDFMDGLRSTGVETGGPAAFGPRDVQAFANGLDRLLVKAMRAR